MHQLPFIQTENPDQTLAACRSLLALAENVAASQKQAALEQQALSTEVGGVGEDPEHSGIQGGRELPFGYEW